MLNSPAPVAQGMPGTLNPPGTQGTAPNGADDGQAFAQALDRAAARQRDAASEAAEPQQREGTEARADAAHAARPDTGPARQVTRAAPSAKAVAAAAAAAAEAAAAASGDALTTASAGAGPQRSHAGVEPARPDDKDAPPSALAAWVSTLPLPRPSTAAAAASAAAPSACAAATTAAKQDGTASAAAFAAPLPLATPRQADTRHAHGMPQAVDDAAGNGRQAMHGIDALAQALAGPRETAAGSRTGSEVVLAAATLPVGWATALPRIADTGTVLQAELEAPVGSSEFAPALGSQLSVMVRNGVEHAQLKLNPADMGPIEVRISLDGTQAQVDFSAANAATRQALQEAVPALASALRESGLTLSGGGVFEQAREQRGDPRQDGVRQRGDNQGAAPELPAGAAPAALATRARGVVDLYA